jgi:hypothetical protein
MMGVWNFPHLFAICSSVRSLNNGLGTYGLGLTQGVGDHRQRG